MTKVQIYSTQLCPWCKKAKAFFKEQNIPFEDIDVGASDEAAKEMVRKSGQRGVPVIDIDGTIILGYDISAIKKALGAQQSAK